LAPSEIADNLIGASFRINARTPVVPISARTCASNSAGASGTGPRATELEIEGNDCFGFLASHERHG